MALGDGQALHGWELVASSGVCDLQGADALIAADHLPVGILNRGDVAFPEGPFHEPQNQGTLAHSSSSKHHHSVVVALLRHDDSSERFGNNRCCDSTEKYIYWRF